MEKQIQVTVELSIVAGKTNEVKQQIPTLVQMVKMTESECISYEWFLNEEKNKCYILEGFSNSEALLAHLINVGPSLPALFANAPITRWEIFGDLSDEVREAILPIGAANNIVPFISKSVAGFNRQSKVEELTAGHS